MVALLSPMNTLYVTDLDGTLIRDDLSLSPWSRRELVSLLDAGVAITVATARSIVSLAAILGDIPFRLPVVEFNGAFVTDYRTKEHLFVNAIASDLAAAVHAIIIRAGAAPFISTFDGEQDLLYYRQVSNPGEETYFKERLSFKDGRLRKVESLEPALRQHVACFTLIDREERILRLAGELASSFGGRLSCHLSPYRYVPGWHLLSVHDAKATKDQGIRTLQENCGLQGAELIVFGDDVNDLGMFRIASRAVAMANACDEVKALAHEMTGSNQVDSVISWIHARELA